MVIETEARSTDATEQNVAISDEGSPELVSTVAAVQTKRGERLRNRRMLTPLQQACFEVIFELAKSGTAYGFNVRESVSSVLKRTVDAGQIYDLLARQKECGNLDYEIRRVDDAGSTREMKVYSLTEQGFERLREARTHAKIMSG